MSVLYGDVYYCRMTHKRHTVKAKREDDALYFKHIIKPVKIGVVVKDAEAIRRHARLIFKKWRQHQPDKAVVKVKRR